MKKLLTLISVLSLSLCMVGCGGTLETENAVTITILNSKQEIQHVLEEATYTFTSEHPDIKVNVIQYNENQPSEEKLISMKQNQATPTISIIDGNHIQIVDEQIISLQEENWVDNISVELSNVAKNEQNELVAFPMALEGMGFIYNKEVLDKAGVDPTSIHTINDLEAAFKKVQQSGKGALTVTSETWSLGNHFFTTACSIQSENSDENVAFIEGLKQGNVDLTSNTVVNGLLDTFDIMKTYNLYANNPHDPTYTKCIELLAKGDVGFFYMGNWITSSLLEFNQSGQYGFIPVPISNNANDYGNNQIMAAVKYAVIDGKDNSLAQQEAAKTFLNWLVESETGQDFVINKAGLIPAFDNYAIEPTDSLSQSIMSYQANGQIIELMNAYIYDNNNEITGGPLSDYLGGSLDRAALLNKLMTSWKEN